MTNLRLSKETNIGWIGTGVMGVSMASHILGQGYPMFIYNRTKKKSKDLIERGANWCNTPGEVAVRSDVVFTIVGFPSDVREIYFGDQGILSSIKPNSVLVDMTTTSPSMAIDIYNAARKKSVDSIDAPVSGGDVGARQGTLSIMVGGDEDAVDSVMPLFNMMGKKITYEGKPGSGQHTKMCNQITIAGTMVGVCEALLYGHRAGLDLNTMLEAISGGAARCWTLDNLAPRIVNRNFEPGFYVEHFVKDMEIALDEARRMNLALPGLGLVHQMYKALQAQGHSRKGTQALILALEKLNSEG